MVTFVSTEYPFLNNYASSKGTQLCNHQPSPQFSENKQERRVLFLLIFLFGFLSWPQTHCVAKVGLEILSHLFIAPKSWDYKHVQPWQVKRDFSGMLACVHACVYVCVHVCARTYACVCLRICMYVHVCMRAYIHMYVCIHVHAVCICACVYMCMSICMCVYMCVCVGWWYALWGACRSQRKTSGIFLYCYLPYSSEIGYFMEPGAWRIFARLVTNKPQQLSCLCSPTPVLGLEVSVAVTGSLHKC